MRVISFVQQRFVALMLLGIFLFGFSFISPINHIQAASGVVLNEIQVSTASTDWEFFEVAGTPGTDLTSLSLLVIESDNYSSAGTIDKVVTLSGSIPSDGFWWAASATGQSTYGAECGTADASFSDNTFENSTATYLLVDGFSGSQGDDLDTNNDGVLDSQPWTELIDGIGIRDSGASDFTYGGVDSRGPDGSFLPSGIYRDPDAGAWASDFLNFFSPDGTPGRSNSSGCGVILNEIQVSTTSFDWEFFEVTGTPGTDLSSLRLLVIESDNISSAGRIDKVVNLSGSIPNDGFWWAASATGQSTYGAECGTADASFSDNTFENSTATYLLVDGFSGSQGDDLDTNNDGVLDSQPWTELIDGIGIRDSGASDFTYGGVDSRGPDGSFLPSGIYRDPDAGAWASDFLNFFSPDGTPGASNLGICEPTEPPEPEITFIHTIQGSGTSTPLPSTTVTIEGIVVGDFQDDLGTHGDLNGFYVQEEDADADGDPTTSEGIFVYQGSNPSLDLANGDLVRITGTAGEFGGQTQISNVSDIVVLSNGNALPTITTISLPLASLDEWEYVEGMLVTVQGASGDLTVNDNYDLGRYGTFQLVSDGRVYTYSQVSNPTDVASFNTYYDAARLRAITIDDGRTNQNPNPTPIINGAPFSAANTVRSGYTTTGVTGILNYSYGEYRIHPTQVVNLNTASNPRTPQASVSGSIRVASFNLLNYFNGDGQGGGFPTSRGADSSDEFARQHDKTIAALIGLDADIIGVMELENDYGDGLNSAAQELVDGLNNVVNNCSNWAYVDPGVAQVGGDAIAVGFLYCTDTVSIATGTSPAILDDSQLAGLGLDGLAPVFNGVSTNRASLAVTFHDISANSNITVAVNHFKSKGSSNATGLNVDIGNGAGAYNQRRRDAANVLNAWLATQPTGTSDNDVLIIGDLNAYAMEDPILDLIGYGYSNLLGAGVYGYGFPIVFGDTPEIQGWGTLDYAMANVSAALQVADATEWHINSDEPVYIDYNVEFKPAALLDDLYDPDAYRASDHDPVVVGLNLNHPPTANLILAHEPPFLEGESVDFIFSNIVDEGGVLTFELDCTNDDSFDVSSNSSTVACSYPDAGSFTVRGRITDSFGDYSEITMPVEILSTVESLAYLSDKVSEYESNGTLNRGQANALGHKIDNLLRSLDRLDRDAALDQIQGIIDQLQGFMNSGKDVGELYYFAQRILIAISINY